MRRELTGLAEIVESQVVQRLHPIFGFVLVVSAFWLSPRLAAADMLVRYPAGMSPSDAAALVASLESIVGSSVLGAAAGVPASDVGETSPVGKIEVFEKEVEAAGAAYKQLDLEGTLDRLAGTDKACLARASFERCRPVLFDAALLRGMALLALGRDADAAHAFRFAHAALPEKVPDPKTYSPAVLGAFSSACAEAERLPTVALEPVVEPSAASLWVNGRPAEGAPLRLTPGRHVVEAQLLGYQRAFVLVDLSTTAAPPSPALQLVPLENSDAWAALIGAISEPGWRPAAPGSELLMRRFRIESVLLVTYSADGKSLIFTLGRQGHPYPTALPRLVSPGDSISEAFADALRAALGLPFEEPPSVSAEADVDREMGPSAAPSEMQGGEPTEGGEASDEEEDGSIQFTASAAASAETESSDRRRILRSPWLWISVGIVASVITGVVLSIQLQD